MPTYDYVCAACGHALEVFQSMSEAPKKKCPKCGKSKLERRIGAGAGFLFKGSGFYLTDYRSKSYTQGSEAEARSEAEAKSAPSAPSATDGKSTTPAPTTKGESSSKSETPKGDSPVKSESPSKSAAKKSASAAPPSTRAKKPKS